MLECVLCALLHSWPLGFRLSLWDGHCLSLSVSNTDLCALFIELCLTLYSPWTVAHQAPLSMELYKQEYWSGLPFPTPRDLPNPGIKPASLVSPALADGFFTTLAAWMECNPHVCVCVCVCVCARMLSCMWAGLGEKCTQ